MIIPFKRGLSPPIDYIKAGFILLATKLSHKTLGVKPYLYMTYQKPQFFKSFWTSKTDMNMIYS